MNRFRISSSHDRRTLISPREIHQLPARLILLSAPSGAGKTTLVRALLERCWDTTAIVLPVDGAYIPMSDGAQVTKEQLPDGARYSARNFVGFGLSADVVTGSPDCGTEVRMYAISGFWRDWFEAVDLAVNGEQPSCP